MDKNPFVKSFEQLLNHIQEDMKELPAITSLYIAKDTPDSIFKELLVQCLKRTINGREINFLAIRNVKLKEEYKGQKYFTHFVEALEKLPVPVLYHDVVNDKLIPFFEKCGYQILKEVKNEHELISFYKLAND